MTNKQDLGLSGSSTISTEGYSTSTFALDSVSESNLDAEHYSSATSRGEARSGIGGTYRSSSTSVDNASSASHRAPDQGDSSARKETAMEQANNAGACRAGGCDVTAVPREIQRSRNQPTFPGLAEDARIFAKKLARLAEGGKF